MLIKANVNKSNYIKPKYQTENKPVTSPLNQSVGDTIELSSLSKPKNVSFGGLFDGILSGLKPADISTDINTISEKKAMKLKQKVANEIYDMIFTDETNKPLDAQIKRLNELMDSDYVDYSIKIGELSTLGENITEISPVPLGVKQFTLLFELLKNELTKTKRIKADEIGSRSDILKEFIFLYSKSNSQCNSEPYKQTIGMLADSLNNVDYNRVLNYALTSNYEIARDLINRKENFYDIANYSVLDAINSSEDKEIKKILNAENVNKYFDAKYRKDDDNVNHDLIQAFFKKKENRTEENLLKAALAMEDTKLFLYLLDKTYSIGFEEFSDINNTLSKLSDYEQKIQKRAKKEEKLFNLDSIFSISDFQKSYNALERYFKTNANDNASIKFVMKHLSTIPLTDENKSEYEQLLNKLSKDSTINWEYKNEFGQNLAHIGVITENPLLLKLAQEKNVSFEEKDNNGDSAIQLVEKYGNNPVVVSSINGMKIKRPEMFKFAKGNMVSGFKVLEQVPNIDINIKNVANDSLLHVAVRNDAVDVVKLLLENPEFDVNAVNDKGDTAGILAMQGTNVEMAKLFIENKRVDLNYINPKTNETMLTSAGCKEIFDELFKSPALDLSVSSDKLKPPIFVLAEKMLDHDRLYHEMFEKLFTSSKVDINKKWNGKNLLEYISTSMPLILKPLLVEELETLIGKRYMNDLKDKVNENGFLTLDEIKNIVKLKINYSMLKSPLNDKNENILFFLADIPVTPENIGDYMKILDYLKSKFPNFNFKNDFGQTVYDKARLAENNFFIDYLTK